MSGAAMRYEVTAENASDGVSTARCKGWSTEFDSGADASPALAGPAELLASAFAACVLKNVSRFARMLPFRYEHAEIQVVAEREDAPPRIARIRYRLVLQSDESQQHVMNLKKNIEKFGTIYNTLAASCEVSGEVVTVEPGARTGGAR